MFTIWFRLALVVSCIVAGLVPAALDTLRPEKHTAPQVRRPHGNTHAKALAFAEHAVESGPNDGIEQARYEDKAYPNDVITFAQSRGAAAAFESVQKMPGGKKTNWQLIGPERAFVPAEVTYTGVANVVSGRVTALAVSPACNASDCKIFVGAAGGGIWRADNALEPRLNWRPSGDGIPTNAIGSLIFDPSDPSGKTLYAGTGEANQSADSEAGLGLFRSTDGGKSWTLVSGSAAVASAAAIATIAVDPKNPAHILIGTNSAVRGGTGVSGGYTFPIPGAPPSALYESVDGGATFTATLAQPVAVIALDPQDTGTVYAGTFGSGVWRRSPRLDGDSAFHLVRDSTGGGERASIALTTKNGHTRIYEARGAGATAADLSRADNADVPAAALLASGWIGLSSPTKGTPGYASYNFCGAQCWYDISLGTPPGRPDEVWLGGWMTYSEIFTANPPSNGRAVQRSIDAGASFTDMTNDANSLGMHPDQHALAFAGAITFVGSDGGVMRTSGAYVDASSQCASRGLSPVDLVDCRAWLSAIPTRLDSLNDGLATLQFNSFSINTHDPLNDIMGGTQDNGTWAFGGKSWFESVGGDGGQSAIAAVNPKIRMHTYAGPQGDVNFNGTDTFGWDWIFDPVGGEAFSFYIPLINDPKASSTWFLGGQHVWRTQDNGGDPAYLAQHCNEFFGDFAVQCGDWVKIGVPTLTGTFYGTDKRTATGNYVVALASAPSSADTLWAATRRGRVFVSTNASAKPASVTFARIDTLGQPGRFISGISVDAADANHAYVSFSGYSVRTPTAPGHVYDVHFGAGTAAWTDISYNIGDQPVTALALDDLTGDLFAATEFGVALLERGSTTWVPAAGSLPAAAVYNLDIDSGGRVLYAATHGRGGWKLALEK
jgi:hypothetical protein